MISMSLFKCVFHLSIMSLKLVDKSIICVVINILKFKKCDNYKIRFDFCVNSLFNSEYFINILVHFQNKSNIRVIAKVSNINKVAIFNR